ncbi:MAG TPA: hypothetical protein VGR16_06105 [Thermomicrobiales bacterium]|nr:hypothetical protein [Thermomicrobiales bacterium]
MTSLLGIPELSEARRSILCHRSWWGLPIDPPAIPTLVDLIPHDLLPSEVAGLLWSLLGRRMPLTVIAPHGGTGKTTLLTALLSLVPADIAYLLLRGCYEPFDFVGEPAIVPSQTALLINEISPHLPEYLWGPAVARALRLSRRGFAIYATAHAESVSGLIRMLADPPLRAAPQDIASLGTIVEMDAWNDPTAVRRQVAGCHGLTLARDGRDVEIVALATRRDREAPLLLHPEGIVKWERRTLSPGVPLDEETAKRSRLIDELAALLPNLCPGKE